MQKRREKQALRAERREAKKAADKVEIPDDPMNDPTIDWGSVVREGHNLPEEETEAEEETEDADSDV